MELNRQEEKRCRFTLYEKMAAVRNIQWHIEVSDLSMRADCRFANLHHRQFITWKSDVLIMQEKRNSKSMYLGLSSILHAFEEQVLCHTFELLD